MFEEICSYTIYERWVYVMLGKIALMKMLTLSIVMEGSHESLHIQLQNNNLMTIEKSDLTIPLVDEPLVNTSKLDLLLQQLSNQVYVPSHNAYLDEHNQIVPEKVGYMLYERKFLSQFYTFLYSNDSVNLEVPLLTLHPKVDSEILSQIRTHKIGQYVTFFNPHNKERSHNILLAAKMIDNTVVFPGEVFSFNKVVGKRTKEKGYKKAPVIVRGELAEDIGGGICQVSSTLFNAVDNAGVKIIERYKHTKRVPYVPEGRDATVSWYGPDFTFKNVYNQPLLIRAKVEGGQVFITVYSSDLVNNKEREIPSALKGLPKEENLQSDVDTTLN